MSDTALPETGAPADGAKPLKARLWPRLPIMFAFVIMVAVAETILTLVAVAQALWLGFSGTANPRIAAFSGALGRWLSEVARYQGCLTDRKPFPWGDWPSDKA